MYTFQALAAVDTLNCHSGFYAMSGICAIILIISLAACNDVVEIRIYTATCAILLAIVGGVSYNTGDVTMFANKSVAATLVGFQAEMQTTTEQHGKTTQQVTHHNTYVVYAVPEGNVMFPATAGQAYPTNAILYKN